MHMHVFINVSIYRHSLLVLNLLRIFMLFVLFYIASIPHLVDDIPANDCKSEAEKRQ